MGHNITVSYESMVDLDIFRLCREFFDAGNLIADKEIEDFMNKYLTDDALEIKRRSTIIGFLSVNTESKNLIQSIIEEYRNLSQCLSDLDRGPRPLLTYAQMLHAMEAYTASVELMCTLFLSKESTASVITEISDVIVDVKNSPFFAKVQICLLQVKKLLQPLSNLTLAVNISESGEAVQISITDINSGSEQLVGMFSGSKENINSLCDVAPIKLRSPYSYLEGYILEQVEKRLATQLNAALRVLKQIDINILREWYDWLAPMDLYYKGLLFVNKLKQYNCQLCQPNPSHGIFEAEDMGYPHLVLTGYKPVPQAFHFSLGDTIMITGANSSGKTSALKSFAQNSILAQLGFWVPARLFRFHPYKQWLTIFSAGEDLQMRASRFQQEAEQMNMVTQIASHDTCMLFNEPFTSTNPDEAAALMCDIIIKLSKKKTTLLLVTHIYDIYELLDRSNLTFIRSFVTGIQFDADKVKYTYTLEEKEPDGLSYARLLADEYGFSIDKMLINTDEMKELKNFMMEGNDSETKK